MPAKFLTALPVYNEEAYVQDVLDEVLRYSRDVLVVDDGSTDDTPERLSAATLEMVGEVVAELIYSGG